MALIRSILIDVSPGELWDRITILRLKADRITDTQKQERVRAELSKLESVAASSCPRSLQLDETVSRLAEINGRLWDVEDDLRRCEARQEFGDTFVELARSVYRLNDQRFHVKLQIDQQMSAAPSEVKQHPAY